MSSLVSVIIPAYNLEKKLEKSLKSLLTQTYSNIEIIIVDDGSKDDTYNVALSIMDKDNRVHAYTKANEGAGPTRNYGIGKAKGKYLYFFDGDDLLQQNFIEIMVGEIERYDVDMTVCGYKLFNSNEEVILGSEYIANNKKEVHELYTKFAKGRLSNSPWNKLYKKDIIINNNITFPTLRRSQDAVFNLNYFNSISSCKYVDKPLYIYVENNLKDTFNKFPKDYFDICLKLNLMFNNYFKEWKVQTDENQQFLDSYFINDIKDCMIFSYSPKWALSKKERSTYFKSIINDEHTKAIINRFNGIGIIQKILVILIKTRNISLINIFINMLIFKMNNKLD